jgi:hypothetical protein
MQNKNFNFSVKKPPITFISLKRLIDVDIKLAKEKQQPKNWSGLVVQKWRNNL